MKNISNNIKGIVLGLIIVLSFAYVLADWSAPLHTPATCLTGEPGCDAPINVGSIHQTKSGPFTLGGGVVTGTSLNSTQNGLIVQNGKVGIGTLTPAQKLHVNGSVVVDPTSDAPNYYTEGIRINAASPGPGYSAVFYGGPKGSNSGTGIGQWWGGRNGDTKAFQFVENGTPMITILPATGSGNVGIGNTTPAEKLDVAGKVKVTGLQVNTATPSVVGQVLTATDTSGNASWQSAGTGGTGNVSPNLGRGGTCSLTENESSVIGCPIGSMIYKYSVACGEDTCGGSYGSAYCRYIDPSVPSRNNCYPVPEAISYNPNTSHVTINSDGFAVPLASNLPASTRPVYFDEAVIDSSSSNTREAMTRICKRLAGNLSEYSGAFTTAGRSGSYNAISWDIPGVRWVAVTRTNYTYISSIGCY